VDIYLAEMQNQCDLKRRRGLVIGALTWLSSKFEKPIPCDLVAASDVADIQRPTPRELARLVLRKLRPNRCAYPLHLEAPNVRVQRLPKAVRWNAGLAITMC
jgi:hypothetical protein